MMITNDIDHITYLHESVLSHILSRLPTEDAICTSILSKEWKNKWMSLYNAVISDAGCDNYESFVNITNRLLVHSRGLRNLHLQCFETCDTSPIETWVFAAFLLHKLEELTLEVSVEEVIVISWDLFNSTSLKVLELRMPKCVLNVGVMNCAPNLTSLKLSGLDITNENLESTKVSFKFPVLEKLSFFECKWFDVEFVEIDAPSLTYFKSQVYGYHKTKYSLTIVAPRLTTFVSSNFAEKIVLTGDSVVSVLLTYKYFTDNSLLTTELGLQTINLLKGFASLENLELCDFMCEVILLAIRLGFVPRLSKLTRLRLVRKISPQQLFRLLHTMPYMKCLTLNVIQWDDYGYESTESVPFCIVSQLEEVLFQGFKLHVHQYKLADFFFRTSLHLKKFVIGGYLSAQSSKISAVLDTFHRCSPCLEVSILDLDHVPAPPPKF